MSTISEILAIRYPQEVKNFQIVVQDDGQGQYIKYWNVAGVNKPTIEEVNAYVNDPIYIYNLAIYNRVNAPDGYGPVTDQMDMIYKDLRDGTQLWQQRIGNVKDVLYPTSGIPTTAPNVTAILTQKRNSPSAAFKEVVIAKSSTTQTIPNAAKTKLVFGTKVSDPNTAFVNNTYTSLTGGLYEVTAFAQVTNYALISLVNNYRWDLIVTQAGSISSSTVIGSYNHAALAAAPGSLQGTYMVYLPAGDTISMDIMKTDATSLNVTFAYLNVKKISDA